jgi:hypothetical protein
MNLWTTRDQSISWLKQELLPEAEVIQQGFDFLNELVELCNRIGSDEGETNKGKTGRICAVTVAKSSHLLLACYSLALDALAQESGALLRPLIETYELFVYLRQDLTRTDEVIDGKLPTAGKISQRISGDFEDLRKHLNDSASHFSYKIDSVRHLLDGKFKAQSHPTQSRSVLETNLQMLNAFQVFVIFEAVNLLLSVGVDVTDLAKRIEQWKQSSISAFSHIKHEA